MPGKKKLSSILILVLLIGGSYAGKPVAAASGERYFPETGHAIKGAFQAYWEQHGGLERFGYPLSDEIAEVSDLNGQTYTVQYFERAEFEHHPENAAPYDVLLTQLGTMRYHQLYPNGAANEQVSTDSPTLFPQTGKHVGRLLLNAWQRLGGLANVGYPISEEIGEKSPLDGNIYLVQYFERAEFEYHPENQPPNDVLLTQLGRFAYDAKYNAPTPTPTLNPPANLPIPFQEGHYQYAPAGSEDYLVWLDDAPVVGYKPALQNVMAMRLATSEVMTIPGSAAHYYHPAVWGATAIWGKCDIPYDDKSRCEIVGKDLVSQQTFTVTDKLNYYDAIDTYTVYGRDVLWVLTDYRGKSLLLQNLDTGATSVIAFYTTDSTTGAIEDPRLSGEYIVWSEESQARNARGNPVGQPMRKVIAQSRNGGIQKTITVTEDVISNYDLDGHHLVYGIDALYFKDLATDDPSVLLTPASLNSFHVKIHNDVIVWEIRNCGCYQGLPQPGIWGMKLSARKEVLLVPFYSTAQINSVIAGDWLIWQDNARLYSTSLAQAFAAAIP